MNTASARKRRTLVSLPALALLPDTARAATRDTHVQTRVITAVGSFALAVDTAMAPLTVANYRADVNRKLLDGAAVYPRHARQSGAETRHRIEVVQWG